MDQNKKKIMVTGHRPEYFTDEQKSFAQKNLAKIARNLKEKNGMTTCLSGGCRGVDFWWALLALDMNLELELYLPFENVGNKWSNKDKNILKALREKASYEFIADDEFTMSAYHVRNDEMLKESVLVVAVWDSSKDTGGTASVVKKARKLKKPLLIIDVNEMKIIKE